MDGETGADGGLNGPALPRAVSGDTRFSRETVWKQRGGSSVICVGDFEGHSTGSMRGYWLCGAWSGPEIRHDEAWEKRARDGVGCQTGIRSRIFARRTPFAVCSVIAMCGSSRSTDAQKNCLRQLRANSDWLVRPDEATSSRPFERRVPHPPGILGATRRVPRLRRREAGAAGFSGGQSALHPALRVPRRPSVPAVIDP